jgi:hypothetical protein
MARDGIGASLAGSQQLEASSYSNQNTRPVFSARFSAQDL